MRHGARADVEEGLGEMMAGEEAPRPVRWNQPLMVIISCAVILGILFTGVGFAIRSVLVTHRQHCIPRETRLL